MKSHGFINMAIIILIVVIFGAGLYLVVKIGGAELEEEPISEQGTTELPPVPTPVSIAEPEPVPLHKPAPEPIPEPVPQPKPKNGGQYITKTVGEQESSFLIQKINQSSVEGLWYERYPVARSEGTTRTLKFGDDIGYACEGISETVVEINFSAQTVTFYKVTKEPPFGGCPICLSPNTMIDTLNGSVAVKEMKVGMLIWTLDKHGKRLITTVQKTSKVLVPPTHKIVKLVLADGRELAVSLGHPTIDGRTMGDLRTGDAYDDSIVVSAEIVKYTENFTYDILPIGETGYYWANGILIASTLYQADYAGVE